MRGLPLVSFLNVSITIVIESEHWFFSSSEARVSGCEGNRRVDDGFCQACGQCPVSRITCK